MISFHGDGPVIVKAVKIAMKIPVSFLMLRLKCTRGAFHVPGGFHVPAKSTTKEQVPSRTSHHHLINRRWWCDVRAVILISFHGDDPVIVKAVKIA